jgi:hypothetical protein
MPDGKNKGGRPKGAKSTPIAGVVSEAPPGCPHCGGHEAVRVKGSVTVRGGDGYHPRYGPFSRRETRRMECRECGGVYLKTTYYPCEG